MENQETTNTGKKSSAPIVIVAILAIAAVGWMVWSSQQKPTEQPEPAAMKQQDEATQPGNSVGTMGEQNTAESGALTEIAVEGGMFYFKPNEIRVKKGETVKLTLNNTKGMHDFVIDELNVKTEVINGGESTTVEFTPDKTGSFEFYCSVGNHRAQGMKGTLIVE